MTNLTVFILICAMSLGVHGQDSKITIEQLSGPYDLGEGPHWDEENNLLYFVDIHEQKFFAFDPSTQSLTETYLKNGPVGVAVPLVDKENTFIAGSGRDLVEFQWDPSSSNSEPEIKVLSSVEADKPNNRFNDGKVDPAGRFWAGTMYEKNNEVIDNQGALYRFEEDGTPVTVLDNITISNGLSWSHDNETFYYIDSPTREVFAYDYDINSGNISNKRVIFSFKENDIPGVPDGMTIDKDGHLWVCVWDGSRILEIDPESKKLLRTVDMPAPRITSAVFGGPNYDILYVTSAKRGLSDADLEKHPAAGYVFAITGLGTSGVKSLNAKMRTAGQVTTIARSNDKFVHTLYVISVIEFQLIVHRYSSFPVLFFTSKINEHLGEDPRAMASCKLSDGPLRIVPLTEPHALSEGPHWDIANQVLYYCDISGQKMLRYDPKTSQVTEAYIKTGPVGVFVPVAGKKNTFLAGSGTELIEVEWNPSHNDSDPKIKVLSRVDLDRNSTRFNDGKVDPAGRFWAGTMGYSLYNQGSLYRFAADGTPTKILSPVSVSNGLCWSHDNSTFYYIDSPTLEIVAYDYDVETGNICNRRVVFTLELLDYNELPDGMTIDKDDNLWVAIFSGGRVIQVDPRTGKQLRVVTMPAMDITSVAFGGPDLDILYVTSGREKLSPDQLRAQPHAGSVFAVYGLGTAGRPMLGVKM
ncbi:uncharacterized protein LOC135167952 [Diachasmimorpha longicaudata]|uniref:uncharacterized protein LOC135167952 n=1 Tax=Diachasmimorpha longicaudata TaxID=58733 RepID=UPI0030B8D406